ncbi:MAG: hypothetical protein WCF16_02460, partial [Alphaproteobacteria bacterium]
MARRAPAKPKPFDVTLAPDRLMTLTLDWVREIQDAGQARAAMIDDGGLIDLFDWFYEQGRSDPADRPFPGAADLTSYFITENVDALRSRLMKAVFGVEPFCLVEGWGADAAKAPYVEEFHEWQIHEEGLPLELAKVIHGALIEDAFVLEVSEKVETRRVIEQMDAALELNDQGGPIFGPDKQPKLKLDPQTGDPVEARKDAQTGETVEPSAKIERNYVKTRRLGPQYDAISMKDFLFLPGHARNRRQLWGYAKRFWLRLPEIQERAKDGMYDAEAVKLLGESSDRESEQPPTATTDIAPQQGPSIEKELWELSLKADLDDDGREEWYVVTVSVQHQAVLRVKLDTFVMQVGRPRCVPFVLFPRRNAVYGYSYAGDKLLTLAEEHTALRNMKADRGALATNAPMTVTANALWDPEAEPFGIGRVIHVNAHEEVRQLVVSDVPNSIVEQERGLISAKERVGGLSDTAIGVLSNEQRTLGENRLAAGGSAVRVDEVIGHLHLAIAEVMQLRHAIWVQTLEADPKGLEAPDSVTKALALRGTELEGGRFTASQLKGRFRFKPYGSSETADKDRQRADFNAGFQALAGIAKVFPTVAIIFQAPDAAKAIVEEWARVYNVRNRQPFLGALQAPALPAAGGAGMSGAAGEGAT